MSALGSQQKGTLINASAVPHCGFVVIVVLFVCALSFACLFCLCVVVVVVVVVFAYNIIFDVLIG